MERSILNLNFHVYLINVLVLKATIINVLAGLGNKPPRKKTTILDRK